MIFFPLAPIVRQVSFFFSLSTRCSTMGLISDSFSHLLDGWSFCRASRWKRFSMSEFIFSQTLLGWGSKNVQIFFPLFYFSSFFFFKIKIKFHRFLPLFSALCKKKCSPPSPVTFNSTSGWCKMEASTSFYSARSSSTLEADKMSKRKYFSYFPIR